MEAEEDRDAEPTTIEGLLQVIDNEQTIYTLKRRLIERQRDRNTLVLKSIKKYRVVPPFGHDPEFAYMQVGFNITLHAFLCVHHIRHVDRIRILRYSRSKTLESLDKITILKFVQEHDDYYGLNGGGPYYEQLRKLPVGGDVDERDLLAVVLGYREDNKEFYSVLQKAKLNSPLMSGGVQDPVRTRMPDNALSDAWLVKTEEQAADVLKETICIKCIDGRYRRRAVWECLSKLVTQPDVVQVQCDQTPQTSKIRGHSCTRSPTLSNMSSQCDRLRHSSLGVTGTGFSSRSIPRRLSPSLTAGSSLTKF